MINRLCHLTCTQLYSLSIIIFGTRTFMREYGNIVLCGFHSHHNWDNYG